MDFIKGNEQVKIDPSGIDISGVGNIIIDSNSITGDISFNDKVNFTGDVSMNGKVTISEKLDVTGDVSMSGIIDLNSDVSMNGVLDICGNIKFGDTHVNRTWFGPDLRGGMNIDGGGWTMMKNLPPNSSKGFNESSTDGIFTQQEGIESLTHVFGRPTSDLTFTPDEVLFTTILNNGDRIWWIFDYTKCANTNIGQPGWVSGYAGVWSKNDSLIKSKSTNNNITYVNSPSGTHIFDNEIYLTSSGINPQPHFNTNVWINDTSKAVRLGPNSGQYPIYRLNIAPGTASTDYNTDFLYYQGMSIFFRDSTNIPTNPTPYPTLIKKELDHLHITAPLNIYPEGNYELDDLGVSNAKDLKFDGNNGTDPTVTVDASGGWYLVRQANNVEYAVYNQEFIYEDNFQFGFDYGTKENGTPYPDKHLWARNVSNYDYDEVLFEMVLPEDTTRILWQIWDRTALETLMSRYNSSGIQVSGIKKSSQSTTPHTVEAHVRPAEQADPQIYYSYPGESAGAYGFYTRLWNVYESAANNRTYYVRRSDGQPVKLKNKVKVDVDGNLDVDGNINCSQITASKTGSAAYGLTVTSEGFVGIGTNTPEFPLDIAGTTSGPAFINVQGTKILHSLGVESNQPDYDVDTSISIHTEMSGYFRRVYVPSDSRIKTEISLVNDDTALKLVNALESKEYHYIDPRRKRPMKTIGFIAQEVKEVIPNAVSLQKEWVPDELRIITEQQWEGNTLTIPNLNMSDNFTGKAKFYVSNDPSGNDEVCEEVEIKEVPTHDSTPLFPKTKFVAEFDKPWANVFFYGKEVTDFHTIDKAQIFALHHSAIQELSRKNDEKTEKISVLENKVNSITVTNALLKSTNESLKSRLDTLENIVAGLQNN